MTRPLARRLCARPLAAMGVFVACATPAFARSPGQPYYTGAGEQPYSVQMHIHGSLSEQNGSMEWHASKAHAIGVDVIWWTDHDWRVDQLFYTEEYNFENCVWDPVLKKFVEPDQSFEQRWWEVKRAITTHQKSIVDSIAYEGAHSLRMEVRDSANSSFYQPLDLMQTGSRKQNQYCLAANLQFHVAIYPEQFDPLFDKIAIQFRLSERTSTWPNLRYVAGSMSGEAPGTASLPATPGMWNLYDIDVSGDARLLLSTGGADSVVAQDNSTFETRVMVEANEGRTVVAFVDDVRYTNDESLAGDGLLNWTRTAAAYYETVYPDVRHFVGSEVSKYKAQPHMNAYAPNHTLIDYTGTVFTDSLYYAVEQVHAQGGLVSYNHPWGVGIYGNLNETPEEKAERIFYMKLGLIGIRVYDCDLLEVGYRYRHGINLAGHLDLWDALTGNAIFLTGTGISDTHGSTPFYGWAPWQPIATYENNYVTWIWATGIAEIPLLDALVAGRAYFGDPYRWEGELDMATGEGFPMGRVVVTDATSHELLVRVTNVPPGAEVRLRQCEIRESPPEPYTEPNWLRQEVLAGALVDGVFTDSVAVDTSIPSFVRLELWNGTEELAFSNYIAFVAQVPAVEGIEAPRVAAYLGALKLRRAEDLVLRAAAMAAGPALELTVEPTAAGLGSLEIDVTPLGVPTSVVGATSWSMDAGVLTVDGFAAPSTQLTISWSGAVPTEPIGPTIDQVSLSTGRPNPFGRGLSAEFALPDPGAALVEVLDVSGRRVRILRDEWTIAGRHRVTWDGRDPYGREVAGGVYFLRLRALGSTLTTKAVKLR